MKFIVSSSLLLKNLMSIGGILNARNTMPILDDFLFELRDDTLKMTASDIETTMIAEMKVDMSEDNGIIAIPAKMLMDVLKTFSDVPITFTVDVENQSIDLNAGEGHYHISGHNGNEFPKLPEIENAESIKLSSDTLSNAISKTLFATSNEELRPSITGVLFDITPEDIVFVATDAHKLVKYSKTAALSESVTSFIVPKKPLNQLKNILINEDCDVTIEYNKTNVTFSFDTYKLFSRLINSPFPNYNMIIPKDNPNVMIIDKNALITTIRRIGIFVSQSTNLLRLSMSGQELIVSGEDIEYANKAEERLNCEYTGTDIMIGFNSRFFLEMLSHIDSDMIRIELSQPNRAAVILPVEDNDSDEKLFMLISPLMLNN